MCLQIESPCHQETFIHLHAIRICFIHYKVILNYLTGLRNESGRGGNEFLSSVAGPGTEQDAQVDFLFWKKKVTQDAHS